MRREFYDIYNSLLRTYRTEEARPVIGRPPPRRRLEPFETLSLRIVDDALSEAIWRTPLQNELRPDAAHLLLINLHQMVTLPLLHPQAPPIHPEELKDDLVEDIRHILTAADSVREAEREITGHRIIEVLARVSRSLRISDLDLWG